MKLFYRFKPLHLLLIKNMLQNISLVKADTYFEHGKLTNILTNNIKTYRSASAEQ